MVDDDILDKIDDYGDVEAVNLTPPSFDNNGGVRDYKCPECNGEFDTFDSDTNSEQRCPFCQTAKGDYE
jgi:rubrerythrin